MSSIGIVIPCFNEENRLDKDYLLGFLSKNELIDILLVNDGSRDKTIDLLNDISSRMPNRIKVLDLKINGGKAEAVRLGILELSKTNLYDWLGYFDADFSTELEEIEHYFKFIPVNRYYDLIVGSRINRLGSIIKRNEFRHYVSRIIGTLTSRMLEMPVYDTQCGAKLINKSVVNALFTEPFIGSWMFDVELFARLILLKGHQTASNNIIEVPLLKWIEKGESKVSFAFIFKLPLELWRIRQHYFNKKKSNS